MAYGMGTIKRRKFVKTKTMLTIYFIIAFLSVSPTLAQETNPIKLLAPQMDYGMTLMQALKDRKTSREFSAQELPLQMLSNLLWAANGINRPDSGHKTAPSAMNMQEVDIYVAKADGLYLYDAPANTLKPVLAQDVRGLTGKQPFVSEAPIDLIYVADFSKMKSQDSDFYAAADTGFISENVYLFCASSGLATVVRGLIDKLALSRAMKLSASQKIILAQTVGYPKGYKKKE